MKPNRGNKPTTHSSAPCISKWLTHEHDKLVTAVCMQDLTEPTHGKAAIWNENSRQRERSEVGGLWKKSHPSVQLLLPRDSQLSLIRNSQNLMVLGWWWPAGQGYALQLVIPSSLDKCVAARGQKCISNEVGCPVLLQDIILVYELVVYHIWIVWYTLDLPACHGYSPTHHCSQILHHHLKVS